MYKPFFPQQSCSEPNIPLIFLECILNAALFEVLATTSPALEERKKKQIAACV